MVPSRAQSLEFTLPLADIITKKAKIHKKIARIDLDFRIESLNNHEKAFGKCREKVVSQSSDFTRDHESRRTVTRQSPYCQTTFSRCFSHYGNISKNVAEQFAQKLLVATNGAASLPPQRYII